MKKVLKNLLYLGTLSALVLSACSDDKTEPPVDEGDYLCDILTFGFYAEDNTDVLTLDYKADIADKVITVRMPEYVDKTALVARFTVTEDDVVKLGDTEIKSGVTAVDYSRTVELVVSDPVSKLSAVYTVRIAKPLSEKWSTAGRIEQGESALGSFHAMRINPKDGNPYIAYWVQVANEGGSGTTRRMAAAKFDGSAFSPLGSEGFSGTVANAAIDIALDSDGTPYVLYLDADNSNGPTVMSYSGGSWGVVGDAGFGEKSNTSNGVAIGIDPSTNRPVTVTIQDISGTAARRSPQYAYYTSAGWVANNAFPGRKEVSGSNYMGGFPQAKAHGGSVYIAMNNAGSEDGKANGYSIYKMTGTNMSTVVEGGLVYEESSTTFMYDTAFDIASDGTIYLVSADDSDDAWKLRVYAFKEGDAAPRQIGSPIIVDVTRDTKIAIAVNNEDIPYLAYCATETGNLINVVSYQTERRAWSDPVVVGSTPVKSSSGERIYFGFNDANVGYLSAMTPTATPYSIELYRLDYIE